MPEKEVVFIPEKTNFLNETKNALEIEKKENVLFVDTKLPEKKPILLETKQDDIHLDDHKIQETNGIIKREKNKSAAKINGTNNDTIQNTTEPILNKNHHTNNNAIEDLTPIKNNKIIGNDNQEFGIITEKEEKDYDQNDNEGTNLELLTNKQKPHNGGLVLEREEKNMKCQSCKECNIF